MGIIVTGGAGFIGSNFILEWLQQSDEIVINLDKLTYAGNLNNLQSLLNDERHVFVRGDIGDTELVKQVLQQYKPRAIINFAAESHVDRSISAPEAFIKTNVVGTFYLLETVREYWHGLPTSDKRMFRFLHISTDEVYGSLDIDTPAFTEKHAYKPNSPYSASKAASDHFVRAYYHTYGMPTITTNCSNNYGPYHFPEKLIPLIIYNALSGAKLPIYGDGQHVRDWLYVSDHCSAIRAVLLRGQPGDNFNIGGWNERTNLEVVRAICSILDVERPRADKRSYSTQIAFIEDRPGHDRRYAVDASKLERELGWKPVETFESGIERTIRWYLANEAWVSAATNGEYASWAQKQYSV